jgi:hypothetical protein
LYITIIGGISRGKGRQLLTSISEVGGVREITTSPLSLIWDKGDNCFTLSLIGDRETTASPLSYVGDKDNNCSHYS